MQQHQMGNGLPEPEYPLQACHEPRLDLPVAASRRISLVCMFLTRASTKGRIPKQYRFNACVMSPILR